MKANGTPPIFASHGLALLHLAQEPACTMRELAAVLGVSERRIAWILRDLRSAGMIEVTKVGKRNTYAINEAASGLHPSLADLQLGDVIHGVLGPEPAASRLKRLPATLLHSLFLPISLMESEVGALGLLPALI